MKTLIFISVFFYVSLVRAESFFNAPKANLTLPGFSTNEEMFARERGNHPVLWNQLESDFRRSQSILYQHGLGLGEYPGFVVSNELMHWTSDLPPSTEEGIHVGFGSLPNLIIGANRNAGLVVFADQSVETLISIRSFWRPLFLISQSPEELLAYLSGFQPKPEDTLLSLFARVRAGEPREESALNEVDAKLDTLVLQERIAPSEKEFLLSVLRDQERFPVGDVTTPTQPPIGSTFRQATGGLGIRDSLALLYDPVTHFEALQSLATKRQERVSPITLDQVRAQLSGRTIFVPKVFQWSKELFENKKDKYALADARDSKFWDRMRDISDEKGMSVSDIYLSNIPLILSWNDYEGNERMKLGIEKLPLRNETLIHESMLEAPFLSWSRSPSAGTIEGYSHCTEKFRHLGLERRRKPRKSQ